MAENATILYFDPTEQQGRLVEIAADAIPEDIDPRWQNYGRLLLAKAEDFPYKVGEFTLLRAQEDGITRRKCIRIGKTALRAMEMEAGKPVALTSGILDRIYALGLGYETRAYFRSNRFKDMPAFRRAIGSPNRLPDNSFDRWSPNRFRQAAAEVEALKGGKPTEKDYLKYAETHTYFPGLRVIERLVGGIGSLNELLGYPDVKKWGDEDYINFGVHFVAVNGIEKFKTEAIDVLSNRKRGPGLTRIREYFGTWSKYKQNVLDKIAETESLIVDYRKQIETGDLPAKWAELSDEELLLRGSRMRVINRLAPELGEYEKNKTASLAQYKSFAPSFVYYAQKQEVAYLTEGEVEADAISVGLFNVIWPETPCYLPYIEVTDNELDKLRSSNNQAHAERWRARKRAA